MVAASHEKKKKNAVVLAEKKRVHHHPTLYEPFTKVGGFRKRELDATMVLSVLGNYGTNGKNAKIFTRPS